MLKVNDLKLRVVYCQFRFNVSELMRCRGQPVGRLGRNTLLESSYLSLLRSRRMDILLLFISFFFHLKIVSISSVIHNFTTEYEKILKIKLLAV